MKNGISVVTVLAYLAMGVGAAAQSSHIEQHRYLWRISRPTAQHSSYLFGTVHLQDAVVYRFGDSVLPALQRCDVFANEWDLSSKANAKKLVDLKSAVDRLTAERKTTVRWRPMQMQFDSTQRPYESPIDNYLLRMALSLGKRTTGLSVMDSVIASIQRAEYLHKETEGAADTLLKMIVDVPHILDLYAAGNLDSITWALHADATPAMEQEFYARRERWMCDSLNRLAQQSSVFAAVGVGHLKRMIAIMRSLGWTVEPVVQTSTVQAPRSIALPLGAGITSTIVDSDSLFSFVMPGNTVTSIQKGEGAMHVHMTMLQDPTRNAEWMVVIVPAFLKSAMLQQFQQRFTNLSVTKQSERVGDYTCENQVMVTPSMCLTTIDVANKIVMLFTASVECPDTIRDIVGTIREHRR